MATYFPWTRRQLLQGTAAWIAACGASAPLSALAQSASDSKFPSKPIRLVVPFAAGGSNDIVARYIAGALGQRIGQTVVVDNKAGANSIIGSQYVAEAPADGYTVLIVSNAFTTNPAVYSKLPFDPLKDFTPIALLGTGPNVLAVWPGLKVDTIPELIALAKSRSTPLHYASSGLGGVHNFTGELFKAAAGIDMEHVAYKGAGQGMIDVISGQVEVLVNTVASALPQIKAGKLKALAVDSPGPVAVLPGVPTIAQSLPGWEGNAVWWGIVGPPHMPAATVAYLNQEIDAVLSDSKVATWMEAQSATPAPGTQAEFAQRLQREVKKYRAIAKASNIRID